jgi:hypothetical protein
MSTVALSMTPEFSREVGIPRVAAIEYPYGRTVGEVDDAEGQRQVLMAALSFLEKAEAPGPATCPSPGPKNPSIRNGSLLRYLRS